MIHLLLCLKWITLNCFKTRYILACHNIVNNRLFSCRNSTKCRLVVHDLAVNGDRKMKWQVSRNLNWWSRQIWCQCQIQLGLKRMGLKVRLYKRIITNIENITSSMFTHFKINNNATNVTLFPWVILREPCTHISKVEQK